MESRNIDELILLDVDATYLGYRPRFDKLKEFTERLFCPVTYGGGICEYMDIRTALNSGADKVAINNSLSNHDFIKGAVKKYGAQCIVASVDIAVDRDISKIYSAIKCGVGEFFLTSIAANGKMQGYDLYLIAEYYYVGSKFDYIPPLIINGGCGEPIHMAEAFDFGADAVAASSIFLFTDHTPRSCSNFLQEQNYPVRLDDMPEYIEDN
jgi:cyclase